MIGEAGPLAKLAAIGCKEGGLSGLICCESRQFAWALRKMAAMQTMGACRHEAAAVSHVYGPGETK